jgi:porphobilinogen synthase
VQHQSITFIMQLPCISCLAALCFLGCSLQPAACSLCTLQLAGAHNTVSFSLVAAPTVLAPAVPLSVRSKADCMSTSPYLPPPHHSPPYPHQDLSSRPRRNRRSATFRQGIRENYLSPAHFILPIFVHEGDKNQPIPSMPGINRFVWA